MQYGIQIYIKEKWMPDVFFSNNTSEITMCKYMTGRREVLL